MSAAGRVDGPIRANSWRDVEPRTLGAAGTRTGRCVWSGRPRERASSKIALARSEYGWVGCSQQRHIADLAHRIVGSDLDEPAVDQAGKCADRLVCEFDRIVIDVAVAVGTERSAHERVGVEWGAKRGDPRHDL